MTWDIELQKLKEDLYEVRIERSRTAAELEIEHQKQQRKLSEMAASLRISELLDEANEVLLGGKGEIEILSSWTNPEENDSEAAEVDPYLEDANDEEEEADWFTAILSWDENGEREIAVDLGLAKEGYYLHINEVDTRLDRDALELTLIQAFRDELEI